MTEKEIRKYLGASVPLHIFESVDSTNNIAKEMARNDAPHGTTVIARHQTGGRGRLGRSFHAPAGSGIYMSTLLDAGPDMEKAVSITAAAAVAVCRAIKEVAGLEPAIKWVNDVYIDGKKVCGILTEAVTAAESGQPASLIVGIGINCSVEGFPEELKDIAGAVEGDYDPADLAAKVIIHLLDLADGFDTGKFIGEYRQLSLVAGKVIKVYKGGYSPDAEGLPARVLGITDSGGLQVIYSSGQQETLTSGEISIRL